MATLWRQLRNPLLFLLAAATVTALLVGARTDASVILATVGLGFFNEHPSDVSWTRRAPWLRMAFRP